MKRTLVLKLLVLYMTGLLVYTLLAGRRLFFQTPNEFVALAEAWLHGRLDIAPTLAPLLDLAEFGGRYYVPYPPAPALFYAPAVALFGRAVYHGLLHALLAAAAMPLFYLVLRRYTRETGQEEGEWLWLAGLLGLGSIFTPLAASSSVYFTGQVVAVLFACLYLLAAWRGRHPTLAGAALGLAFLSRGALLLAFPIALAEIWQAWSLQLAASSSKLQVALLRFGLGLSIVLAAAMAYNGARFGSALELGYRYLAWRADPEIVQWGMFHVAYLDRNLHAALTAVPVLLPVFPYVAFHPEGMSLLLTMPVLILLPTLRRWTPTAKAALLATLLVWLPALFYANTGFVQYGYRYAADWLPFLLLAMALAGLRVKIWPVKALILAGGLVCLWGGFLAGHHPYTPAFGELIDAQTPLRFR